MYSGILEKLNIKEFGIINVWLCTYTYVHTYVRMWRDSKKEGERYWLNLFLRFSLFIKSCMHTYVHTYTYEDDWGYSHHYGHQELWKWPQQRWPDNPIELFWPPWKETQERKEKGNVLGWGNISGGQFLVGSSVCSVLSVSYLTTWLQVQYVQVQVFMLWIWYMYWIKGQWISFSFPFYRLI